MLARSPSYEQFVELSVSEETFACGITIAGSVVYWGIASDPYVKNA